MIQDTRWKIQDTKGFTIIEALVVLFIFALITFTFYRTYAIGIRYIADAKSRLGAISVANEKMEIIRNLKYEDIGTVGGAVSGDIPDTQNVSENASQYVVETTVEYADDVFDGTFALGTDLAPEDYKKVSVDVSWNGDNGHVELTSRFVPQGLEVANPGDGILQINVFSDQPGGSGIPSTSVHVVNTETGLDTTVETDSSGSVILMGDRIQNSIQNYRITLSKSGYEAVSTMPPYPTTDYDPVDIDASVVVGSMNVANIVQNKLATLKVKTVDYLGASIPNIGFNVTGGRILGNTIATELDPITFPVFNLKSDTSTDSSGEKDFGSVSPGQFTFSLLPTVTGYEFIDTDPISPVSVFSENNMVISAKLADKNFASLLVKIVSSVDGVTPVSGAEVRLTNGSGYDVTQSSSETGKVFFPNSSDPFLPGTYDLKITADGFSDNDSQVTINADQLNKTDITLTSL